MTATHDPSVLVKAKLVELINEQIKNELKACAQYTAIAIYFDEFGLPELAGFFYNQADEERDHAMRFIRYLLDAGAKPLIPPIPEVRNEFTSPADAVECALEGELQVTKQVNNLVAEAQTTSDHMTHTFLQWFVEEQLEEVSTMKTLLQVIKHAGSSLLLVEDYVRRLSAGSQNNAE